MNILYQDEKLTYKEFMECLEECSESICDSCPFDSIIDRNCRNCMFNLDQYYYNEDTLQHVIEDRIIRRQIEDNLKEEEEKKLALKRVLLR